MIQPASTAEVAEILRLCSQHLIPVVVMGLEAVLPSGEVIRTGGKNAKDVAGYDLTRLLAAPEDTLAVVTRATLKLLPLPEARRTALALFHDMVSAGRAVSQIIAARIIPATREFLDNGTLDTPAIRPRSPTASPPHSPTSAEPSK